MGTNDEDKEEFTLYTEKVVLRPGKKYRWLIRLVKFFAFVAGIIVAATVFLALIWPMLQKKIEESIKKDKEVVVIQKDPYVYVDDQYSEDPDVLTEQDLKNNYDAAMAALRAKVSDVQKNMVMVDVEQPVSDIPPTEKSETETAGLIMEYANSHYLILTSSSVLISDKNLVVKLNDTAYVPASFVAGYEELGLCIISISDESLTKEEKDAMSVAILDNSYKVRQGDLVIASGKIYGNTGSVDYGTISGINTRYGMDNGYDIFETNVAAGSSDFGFLFNSEGKVVGVAAKATDTTAAENSKTLRAVGISDIKGILQSLINHNNILYCGIKGQNVTKELAAKYNLPIGFYVSSVEIDSPAYVAGIQAGDVIVKINGTESLTIQDFNEKLYQCQEGQTMLVTVKRLGKDEYSEVMAAITVKFK